MLSGEEKPDSTAVGNLVDNTGGKECQTGKVCATLVPGKGGKIVS